MALFPYDNVATVVSDAAVELGWAAADIADPFGSSEQSILLLCRLLKRLGRDLLREWEWSYLRQNHSFATVNGTTQYQPPSDMISIVDRTVWNASTRLPLTPITAQQWETVTTEGLSGAVTQYFRITSALTNYTYFEIYPTPSSAQTITFEYLSNLWVRSTSVADGDTNDKAYPTVAADTLCLDANLLVCGLKLYGLRAKGFDSAAAQQDFEDVLEKAKASDRPSGTLALTAGVGGAHMLDGSNVPDTGYGS